jgi:hypothetical protein
MRPKDLNAGLRGGLFEAKHCARMGQAVWLYGWLVLRQTTEHGATGLVLGGHPITYREIEQETGFNRRTLERWMRALRRQGYIETSAAVAAGAPTGISVRILKAKKFGAKQRQLQFPSAGCAGLRPPPQPSRAEGPTQMCGADARQVEGGMRLARAIESRETVRQEHTYTPLVHGFPAEPALGSPGVAEGRCARGSASSPLRGSAGSPRRTTREEQARRELGVGAGPQAADSAFKPSALERLKRRLEKN